MTLISRRSLLGFFAAAPLVVPAVNLMRLRGVLLPPEPTTLSAFQILYRSEFIEQFERGNSWLRSVISSEVNQGQQSVFYQSRRWGAHAA